MKAVQIDMFDTFKSVPTLMNPPRLNGFYYERSSNKFVSFVLGKRHFEISARSCRYPKDWQEMLKRERSI
jgi:hypothetical protein